MSNTVHIALLVVTPVLYSVISQDAAAQNQTCTGTNRFYKGARVPSIA